MVGTVENLQKAGTIPRRKQRLKTTFEIVPKRTRPSVIGVLLETVILIKVRKLSIRTQMPTNSDRLYLIAKI